MRGTYTWDNTVNQVTAIDSMSFIADECFGDDVFRRGVLPSQRYAPNTPKTNNTASHLACSSYPLERWRNSNHNDVD